MQGKVAIEEHFVTSVLEDLISGGGWSAEAWRQVTDCLRDVRHHEQMDRLDIEIAVLSLGSFGIQEVVDPQRAVARARGQRRLAEIVRAPEPRRWVRRPADAGAGSSGRRARARG